MDADLRGGSGAGSGADDPPEVETTSPLLSRMTPSGGGRDVVLPAQNLDPALGHHHQGGGATDLNECCAWDLGLGKVRGFWKQGEGGGAGDTNRGSGGRPASSSAALSPPPLIYEQG